ncbi:MAG: MlaD family protein [Victivallaceae bacterium]
MIEANKFRLGLFVLAGVVLFLICIFLLGLSDLFAKKAKVVTFFRESVQGIAVGTSVKYKGVPIGTVSKITIQVNDKLIRVDMNIELKSFSAENHKTVHGDMVTEFYKFCTKECAMGLRCRLEYAGITGLKYIELDYFDPDNKQPVIEKPAYVDSEYFYIPSTPSMFKDILNLINTSLERISKIKFEEMSNELTGTISEVKKILSDPKLRTAIQKLEAMSDNLEKSSSAISTVLTESKVREIVTSLEKSLNSLNGLAERVNAQVKDARFADTSNSFREAADSINQTRQTLTDTLLKLDQALDAMTELINYLNDDPSALLKGKKKGRIKFSDAVTE